MERQGQKNLREYSTPEVPFFDEPLNLPPLTLNTNGHQQIAPMQELVIVWQDPNLTSYPNQEPATSQQPQAPEKVEKKPFEFTLEFLRDAEEAKIPDAIIDSLRGFRKQKFLEGLTVLDRMRAGITTRQIATELVYSTQGIDWRRKKTFEMIWQNCPDDIKEKYPYEELTLHNPRVNSIETRVKQSLRHGGKAVEIAAELVNGTEFSLLKERFGLDSETTCNLRSTLSKWGIEIPYEVVGHELKKTIDSVRNGHLITDAEAETFFKNLTISTYRNQKGKNGTLMPLKEPVTKAGYRYASRLANLYLDEIRRSGIPFGKLQMEKAKENSGRNITVNAFFRIHTRRIKRVLRANPDFDKYKIPSAKSPKAS